MTGSCETQAVAIPKATAIRRLYLGTGLMISGTALAVLGVIITGTGLITALGMAPGRSLKLSVAAAALVGPVVFGAALVRVPASGRLRLVGILGLALAGAGVAVLWTTVPSAGLAGPVGPLLPAVGLYALGLAIAVAAPLLAAATAVEARVGIDDRMVEPD